ncbi:MAG: hypothetical protein ABI481_10965 [Pyrinomonadaceae bacterium]
MPNSTIEGLIMAANSSPEGDSSLNLAKRVFLEQAQCDDFFENRRSNLLDINEWNKSSSASMYALIDESGRQSDNESISVGIFIRISLYGSGKYDWVRVTSIEDGPDELVVIVKPSYDPTHDPRDTVSISHFFGPEATNSFCLQRDGKTVAFYVIGLDEHQNTKFTDGLIESARNAAVANIGYYSGLQKSVWKEFCSNFLSMDEEKGS